MATNAPARMQGVLTPVITPFDADLNPDAKRLVSQCRWLLTQNVGLAIFGTNSEANSLSVEEKIELMDALVEAGIPAARMMPGTGCCAVTDSARLTAHAVKLGAGGVLMLPPFYYKGVSDDGLFAAFAQVIERVGDARLRVYLYHIPPVSNVPLSIPLVERLIKAYPETVVGIKDSSGVWSNTEAMLDAKWDDFRIFPGSEEFLLAAMRKGGAGCISATANVNPAAIHALYANWRAADADTQQAKLNTIRGSFAGYVMIPGLKAVTAHYADDDGWRAVRPPLVALTAAEQKALVAKLEAHGFAMRGLTAKAAE
jgi:4-hydroxy-tetrahydrodipicolinate synthase